MKNPGVELWLLAIGGLNIGGGCSFDTTTIGDTAERVTPESGNGMLAPPEFEDGVQLQMLSELAAGVETERCRFFVAPREGLYVNRQEVRFTPGSHHVLLFTTPYTELPTHDRFGTAVETSGVFECGPQGATAHWQIDGVAGGSQSSNGPPIVQGLPEGTAVKIPGGSVLLMNTHYLNASSKSLLTDARINLYTIPQTQVNTEAGFVFFYNPFIRVAPVSVATAREVCPVLSDVQLVNAQNHMHKRGVYYRADLLNADGTLATPLYEGTEWAAVVMQENDPHQLLQHGQSIDYRCDYRNPEHRVVTQGLSTADEMCMFVGLYYPRNRQFELCGMNDTWDGAFLGARWVGSGSRTGLETLDCFMGAAAPSEDQGGSFYGCVVDSCPGTSQQMSDAARCLVTRGFGQCTTECQAGDESCQACYGPVCQPSLRALTVAGCN